MAFTPQLTIYDFDQVYLVLAGAVVDGFAPNTPIRLTRETDTFSHVVGADGKVARSKTLQRTARLEISLLQTSASNDILSAVHILDRDAPNGAGIFPFALRDKSGRSMYSGAQCWVMKAPDPSFEREATQRDWVIAIAKLEGVDGGN